MTTAFTCDLCQRRIERPGHLPLRKAVCGQCQPEDNEEAAEDVITAEPPPPPEPEPEPELEPPPEVLDRGGAREASRSESERR